MSNFPRKTFLVAIVILVVANVALFWKFYFKGLLPFPGDLLVSFYFPWNSGGFAGFDPWTTRKGVIAMDVIRQIYPWKTLAFDLIRQGQLPLWNPYNFSGTPLLANLQSSVFFPTNFLFLILPYLWVWIGLVVSLPFLFSLFSYLFLRSLRLSNPAAIFGAIALTNLSYITVWAEQLVVIQSALFLPLILWSVNKYRQTNKSYFLLFIPLLLTSSLFGGHLQTTLYVYIIAFAYMLFKRISFRFTALSLFISLGLAAIQLFPSLELYLHSAREGEASKQLFYQSTLPWQNLITLFAPDFFGNPATKNFRGFDYGNFQGYFGIAALILATFVVRNWWKNQEVKFFMVLGSLGLIFSLAPFAYIFDILKVPILSSGYPSRLIFIFQFCFAILAALGLEHLLTSKHSWRKVFLPVSLIGLIYLLCWILTLSQNSPEWLITRNNLILPTGIFLIVGISLVLSGFFSIKSLYFVSGILCLVSIAEYSYFFNKYQPFAPTKFVFPNHPVFTFLQKQTGEPRFFGQDRAYIDNNFATHYRVYSPEGYDPLYIRRYGELLTASKDGRLDKEIPRSDAWVKTDNEGYRNRILDILGVKYEIDKTDDPQKDYGPNPDRFPQDEYNFVTQVNKWKFYERKSVLPRAILYGDYNIISNPQEIITTLYSPTFDPKKTVILEKDPGVPKSSDQTGNAQVLSYSPNDVVVKTESSTSQILFLSDNFYSGWKASVDGRVKPIYRADYSFKAVVVPQGDHEVIFWYDPLSFKLGAGVSLIVLLGLGMYPFLLKRRYEIE